MTTDTLFEPVGTRLSGPGDLFLGERLAGFSSAIFLCLRSKVIHSISGCASLIFFIHAPSVLICYIYSSS